MVNNAGVAAFAEAEWCSLSQYQTMMNINWLGTVRVTKSFLPLVRAARGRVINLASMAGHYRPSAALGFSSSSSSFSSSSSSSSSTHMFGERRYKSGEIKVCGNVFPWPASLGVDGGGR